MTEKQSVSYQAFVEQIQNWELTLVRESKKLKQLKKSTCNKFKLNSIEIALTEISSEFINYKKTKDKKLTDNQAIVQEYTRLSRRFMHLMERIGSAAEQEPYNNETLILDATQELLNTENVCPNPKTKHFLQETFTNSKPSRKKASSFVAQNSKQLNEISKKKIYASNNKSFQNVSIRKKSKMEIKPNLNLRNLEKEEQEDLWDIRYQLREIKSMMVQMENEIKFHNHEDIERELNKLEHGNKKLTMELKSLKEDHQVIQARLENIKEEIVSEKGAQVDMIKQFQTSKENSRVNFHEISKSQCKVEDVSDWVKVRI